MENTYNKDLHLVEVMDKHFDAKVWSPPIPILLHSGYWNTMGVDRHTSGVYKYFLKDKLVYIGMSERSIFGRTRAFVNHVEFMITGYRRCNESHAKRFVTSLGYQMEDLKDMTVSYCPVHSKLARSMENHLINQFVKGEGNGGYPILNARG